jgi:hypothetical protein
MPCKAFFLGVYLHTYFEYHHIWVNMFLNDHHLNNITKLKLKTLNQADY